MGKDNTIIGALGQTPPPSENYYFIHDENGNVLCDIDKEGSIKARYIYANSKHIAKKDRDSRVMFYYHFDPLGSPLVITTSGLPPSIRKQYKYRAFGELKYESGTYYDNHKFTGKEEDGSGLYYFGARYYDKSLGRWITPDPKSLPSDLRLKHPQSLNPYVYCWNNPLRRIDKDGKEAFSLGVVTYFAIGAGTAVTSDILISSLIAGKSPVAYIKSEEYTIKRFFVTAGIEAVTGAAFGHVAGAAISVGTKLALAAGINIFGAASKKAILEGESMTPKEGFAAGAIGSSSMLLSLGATELIKQTSKAIQAFLGGAASGATSTDAIETALNAIKISADDEQEYTPPTQTSPYQYEHAPAASRRFVK